MRDKYFEGPIFIAGMPRSGTKLLRDILNNHSIIAIPPNDSHCIPYFSVKIVKYGDFSNLANFKRFYDDFSNTIFFQRLVQKNIFIDNNTWYNAVRDWSYAGIMETFYKSYARRKNKDIWGDKTPSYLLHLPLLKSLFPQSKFIHIIRDARDYCLSLNKGWKKNAYRAAQRWFDSIKKCRQDAQNIDTADYFEVYYERLTDWPDDTVKSICDFLDVSYESNMLALSRAPETAGGDAAGFIGILKQNYGKWEKYWKSDVVAKIERICGPLLSELGYMVSYQGEAQSLTKIELVTYKILDGWNILIQRSQRAKFGGSLRNMIKSRIHRIVWKR